MFAALAVVVTVSGLVACLLQLSQSITRQQVVSVDNKRAFYIAEAGLSEGLYGLYTSKSGAVGTSEVPARFGDGYFWVEAVDQGSGRVKLDSTGLAGQGRFALSVTVVRKSARVGSLGIFAESGLTIGRGTFIDSYNSIHGAYVEEGEAVQAFARTEGAPPALEPAPMARVGANVDVAINGTPEEPVVVHGDVTPGSAHSVLVTGSASISGSTTPREQEVHLPSIEVPAALPAQGSLSVPANATVIVPTGQGQYPSIYVPATGRLEIKGPIELAVETLTVAPGGQLHFDATAGSIDVYVTQRLWIQDGATMSGLETPSTSTSLLISASEWSDRNRDRVLDPPADLRAQGRFYGTIYAPHSPLTIVSGFELNRPIREPEMVRQSTVPTAMMAALRPSVRR